MADNVAITAGSGTSIATDQCGTDHYQKVKLVDGTADSTTAIAVDVGAKANALRVAPANDITDATYIGDIKFGESLPAGTNAIGKLAANSGIDIGDVDVKSCDLDKIAGESIQVAGGTEAKSIRVTIANDSTGLLSVDDNGGALTVDATNLDIRDLTSASDSVAAVCTNAGTFAVQATLDAETTKVIGTVNVAASQEIEVTQATAADLNVTEASASDIKTAVQVMDDWDDSNYCNVNMNIAGTDVDGNSGNKGAQTQRVCIATDDVNVSAIKTSVELQDDTVATLGSAIVAKATQIAGLYDSTLPTAVDDGDAVTLLTDKYGRLLIGTDPNITRVEFTHTDVSTAHEVIAASASNYFYITSFILSVDTASSYWFEDGDAAAITGKFYLAANGGVSWTCAPGSPLKTKTVNKALNIKSAGAGSVGVTLTYYAAP